MGKERNLRPAFRRPAVLFFLAVAISASVYLFWTWPDNLVGIITYRFLGKPLPSKSPLQQIRLFLAAKRKLDKKDFAGAHRELEYLRQQIESDFPFFKEVYMYLGYLYDVKGDLKSEEALYRELEGKDETFAKFMFGLYHIKHGRAEQGHRELFEALKLDDRTKRLGKYREVAEKELGKAVRGAKQP